MPNEYRASPAVITKVAEAHCTVVVLDERQQSGVGECWPGFHDVTLESLKLRIGTHVVIDGMVGTRTRHLNGLTGIISEHPKEGHPVFIRKSASPDTPILAVCVCFNDPNAAKGRSALIEPRFLVPFDEAAFQTAKAMSDVAAALTKIDPTSRDPDAATL